VSGVEELPVAQGFERREPDGEQHAPLIAHLALAALAISVFTHSLSMLCGDRISSSLSCRRMAFVDLLGGVPAALNVVRSKPAAHTFVLQVGIEAVGEVLVFGGVADEAGVELDGIC